MLARRNLERMQGCAACMPDDISADMIVAANDVVLGLSTAAAALYRSALRFDRRPEIYVNLAGVELELGQRDQAREHLVLACLFNPWYISQIDDGMVRDPDGGIAGGALPARRKQRADRCDEFRLHEELRERGVCSVGRG